MLYNSPFLQLLEQLPPSYEICIHNNKVLTAKELIAQSKKLAAYLEQNDIKKGDHVLLACEMGIEFQFCL